MGISDGAPDFSASSNNQQQLQQQQPHQPHVQNQTAPPFQASEVSVSSSNQQEAPKRPYPEHQTHPSVQASQNSASSSRDKHLPRQETVRKGEAQEHRSRSRRRRRKHSDKKQVSESDAFQEGKDSKKLPVRVESTEVDKDERKHGRTEKTPVGSKNATSSTVQAKLTKNEFDNLDQLMKIQRRQSMLAQNPAKANLIVGLQPIKREKKGRRRHQKEYSSSDATADAGSVADITEGDVFAKPIINELFEKNPSKSTTATPRRASVIAPLMQKQSMQEGSRIVRPSEFRALNTKVSSVTGDPVFDQSLSVFFNNDLFENKAHDFTKKSGLVFVALPIPPSGVVSDPREALAQAGWVKSHPNDPLEETGGISTLKRFDKYERALGGGPSLHSDQAVERDKIEAEGSLPGNSDAEMGRDSATFMNSTLMESDLNRASATNRGMSGSILAQPIVSDEPNNMAMPDLWSQGFEFDPATAWQRQSASIPLEGSPPQFWRAIQGQYARFGVQQSRSSQSSSGGSHWNFDGWSSRLHIR
ncbi:hypothetical protein Mapa_014863 [Marchantia paleacea]|nr:hypothetical protein Mapa_014863 [Marchantia paleacea]